MEQNLSRGKFRFTFRHTNFSPGIHKRSPLNDEFSPKSNIYPVRSCKSPVPDLSVINEIVFQCRRLDSDFSLFPDNDYSQSVINAIRKAVDFILDCQHRDWGLQIEEYQSKLHQLNLHIEELNKKIKSFSNVENDLIFREEKISLNEMKILNETKTIQNDKNEIVSLKKHYINIENQLKSMKKEVKEAKKENSSKDSQIKDLLKENIELRTEIQEIKNKALT